MCFTNSIFSQTANGIDESLSYGVKLETIFDNYGNKFKLSDIAIGPHKSRNSREILESKTTCNPGIFTLYFENGSGMEGTSQIETDRRAVVCQVFQDLSNLINSPLNTTGNRVNIWVRGISQVPNVTQNTLGLATGFYNVPQIPTVVNGGIADNEIWKTIHAGIDSFTNVSSLIVSTSGNANSGGSFYHGMMAFNFANFNWNTNMSLSTSNLHDLYSVALHEVTHALGFVSLINVNGASNFTNGYNYYSRYDTFLIDHNFNRLISNTGFCSTMYNNTFIASNADLHPGCSQTGNLSTESSNESACPTTLGFLGSNLGPIEIYTPKCFEIGSSLSHFEDQCYSTTFNGTSEGNDEYFVMSNANAAGTIKRFLKPEERTALCDIGYSLRTTYGGTAALSFFNYAGANCDGSRVAGVNDGLLSGNIQFVGNVNSPITISGILNNDVNYSYAINGLATNNLSSLRFECVEDVYYDNLTTMITSNGNDSTSILTFQSSQPGLHLLRYVPFDSITQDRGNITYVYVFVRAIFTSCGVPTSCNLIINGNFEQNSAEPVGTSEFQKVCGWRNDIPTADYFSRTALGQARIPCNFIGFQETTTPTENNHYVGQFISNGTSELISSSLVSPLLPNTSYKFEIDLSLAENCSSFAKNVQIYFSNDGYPFTTINNNMLFQTQLINDTDNWTHVIISFTTNENAGENVISIGNISNIINQDIDEHIVVNCPAFSNPNFNYNNNVIYPNFSYYYIDNVSLIPIPTGQFNLPQQICQTETINLSDFLGNIPQNGVFSGEGVSLVNGNYIFNATNLSLGGHSFLYTYTDNLGCPPITLTDDLIVVETCISPFISQVYCQGPENSFIEIKNPSKTESISEGSYFLNFYGDGAPTNDIPTSFIDIGSLAPSEVKVFHTPQATTPAYAVTNINVLPIEFAIDGAGDVLIISTSNNEFAYDDRTDLVGNYQHGWSKYASLVRSGCASTVPRTDVFDYEDWSRFELDEIESNYFEGSKTNPELGRHHQEVLHFDNFWHDVPIDYNSMPDRSRVAQINRLFDTDIHHSFECCSLNALETVKIQANDYISIENNLDVQNHGFIQIQNNGSLVMVKDTFHGVTNTNLIQVHGQGQIITTKTTVGLDAYTDYVYWSTPLANIPLNDSNNTATNLFPSPLFNSSRFYEYLNINFQDIPNFFMGTASTSNYANGYDDNLDDYHILNSAQRNLQLNSGLGYATWPPSGCGSNCNYSITFNGTPNNGVVAVPVYHNTPSNSYTNLVGNPYPSAINLDRLFEVNAGLIDPVAFIWGRSPFFDNDTPNSGNPGPYPLSYSQDSYMIYNPNLTINPNPFNVQPDGTSVGTLASCQSFFVQTITNNPDSDYNGNLIFNNSMRTKLANNTFARQSSNEKGDKLWLNVINDNEEKISQTGFAFLKNASDEFSSKEDVKTFRNNTTTFYSIVDNLDLVINVQSSFKNSKIIPLGITTSAELGSQLSITIDKKQGVFNNHEIYIYDKLNNTYNEISTRNFKFKVTNTIMDDRFILVFDNIKIENQIELLSDVNIVNDINNITVKCEGNVKIESIEVFDIYNFSINGLHLLSLKELNTIQESFIIDEKYKLLLIVTTLEDGTIVSKKITN